MIGIANAGSNSDQIVRVRVSKLFGMFDHDIKLHNQSPITVIHGPNGVGKTYVLRMIAEAMSGEYDVLFEVPFAELQIYFKSNDYILFNRNFARDQLFEKEHKSKKSEINYERIAKSNERNVSYIIEFGEEKFTGEVSNVRLRQLKRIRKELGNKWNFIEDEDVWVDSRDGETLKTDDLVDRYGFNAGVRVSRRSRDNDEHLSLIESKCRVRLIETDRLHGIRKAKKPTRLSLRSTAKSERDFEHRVSQFSENLKSFIDHATSQFGEKTTEKERTFLKRVSEHPKPEKETQKLKANELMDRFETLRTRRKKLSKSGILANEKEGFENEFDEAALVELISRSIEVVDVYIKDMDEKLSIFDDLEKRINFFKSRLDKLFSNKDVLIDKNRGLLFRTITGKEISPAKLSSGEQHEVVLLFQLAFESRSGDLVLIDEPELSLHLAWQSSLIEDFKSAFSEIDLNILLATHSSAIVNAAEDIAEGSVIALSNRMM